MARSNVNVVLFGCLWSLVHPSEALWLLDGIASEEAPLSAFATYDIIAEAPGVLGNVASESSFLQMNAASVKLNNTVVAVTSGAVKVDAKQKLEPKTWWAITITTALVVKTLCMVSNVIFQISPLPGVKEFYSRGDTGQTDAAPYMSIFFGGFQWCFYGIYAYIVTEKAGFLVLVYSNFLGPILGSGYVFGFWQNCQDSCAVRRLYKYMSFAAALVLMQVVVMCSEPCQKALFFSGFVSSVCSVMVSLSMLATVPIVYETKCSSSINVTVTIVGVVSGMLWMTCGCILKDKWIMVPNSIGLVILLFTLSLTVRFPQDPAAAQALLQSTGSEEQRRTLPLRSAFPSFSALSPENEEVAVTIRSALNAAPEYGAVSLGKPFISYSGDTGGTM